MKSDSEKSLGPSYSPDLIPSPATAPDPSRSPSPAHVPSPGAFPAARRAAKLRRLLRRVRKAAPLTVLAAPGIVLIFVLNYLPMYGLILPFKNYKFNRGFWGSEWAGLSNFKFLFNGDILARILRNTIAYNLAFILVGTLASVAVALLLFELSRRATTAYQTALFIPYFVSWVVASYAVMAILDFERGSLNKFIELLGLKSVMWYNEANYWPAIILVVAVWKGLGYSSVIYYAALMGINSEFYEAATIDGAGRLQKAWHISVPSIKNIIVMIGIMNVGKIFYSDFGLFYNVPLNSPLLYRTTDVIDTFVYRSLTAMGDIGMASAAGFFQSFCGFMLVLATNAAVRKISEESSLF
ncbi:MAG: ABC transporter permease subunit [Clostridiales bacterium]|jgi:putative aldouronate transport system permease protein|nr:ABC transporter permease subunit [Clostridiales bacterium]